MDTPDSFSVPIPLPSPAQLSTEKPSCQVEGGQAKCMPAPVATCRAQGDPHYTTFDGRRYDMMGTCSYTMAELNSKDQTLPAFNVEAKNEHRSSSRVSYVGFVTVRAYSLSVSLARGEVGFARVSSKVLRVSCPSVSRRKQSLGVRPPTRAPCHGEEGAGGPRGWGLVRRDLQICGRTFNPFRPAIVLLKMLRVFRDMVRERILCQCCL